MSLIQDALKRQQEETESNRVPMKTEAPPSVPDAMPVPPSPPATLGIALRAGPGPVDQPLPANQPLPAVPPATTGSPVDPEKPVQPGKSWKWIAGIIVFCVLLAWGGGLLVVLIMKQSAEHTLLGQFMPDLIKTHATSGKSSDQPPPTAISKPEAIPASARESASKPWISPAAAAAPAFADEGEDALENEALQSMKAQGASAAVPGTATWPRRKLSAIFSNVGSDQEGARLKPVVWPRLKLSAVFSNMGSGQSGARLNNRLILLGDQIDGVTLIEIRRDSVLLKCGKETRSLKMGMTLN